MPVLGCNFVQTCFTFFLMQNIKSSNPELATTEIAKKLGEKWHKMTGNTPDLCFTQPVTFVHVGHHIYLQKQTC
jgi:hypothetical protein